MRTAPDEAPAEIYARMTRSQKNAMQVVRAAEHDMAAAESVLASRTASWQAAIFRALEERVPARLLASELGLSQSRIYQIRDEVASHRNPVVET